MVEHTILASTLWLHVFIHFLSSLLLKQSKMQLYEQKVTLIMKTKGHIDILRQRPQSPRKFGFTHARTGFQGEANIRSSLAFIKEMHSIAISGRHILPLTYRLIALLLHKGKMDSCIFDALYFFN